ncbi:unnamed protein product, partial [Closterium sp. NIES-54]
SVPVGLPVVQGGILEGVVTTVNKVPVAQHQQRRSTGVKMGFFAEAGPVQIFVSNHLIPDDMSFTPGDINSYQTEDGTVKIQADSEVRLKIVGTRVDATEIVSPGGREIVSVRVIIDSDEMGAVEMGAAQMDAFGTVGTGV